MLSVRGGLSSTGCRRNLMISGTTAIARSTSGIGSHLICANSHQVFAAMMQRKHLPNASRLVQVLS